MKKLEWMLSIAALGVAVPLAAQGVGRYGQQFPKGWLPPAGMCRIWINGVPANRQPNPTDCNAAQQRVPPNGQVIYGPSRGPNGGYGNQPYGVYGNQPYGVYGNQPYGVYGNQPYYPPQTVYAPQPYYGDGDADRDHGYGDRRMDERILAERRGVMERRAAEMRAAERGRGHQGEDVDRHRSEDRRR